MRRAEYTHPSEGLCSIESEAREQFFAAVAKLVPEVVRDLHEHVLPVYLAADQACDNELQHNLHLDMDLWLQPGISVLDMHAELHPDAKAELEALKAAIASWGDNWNINKLWVGPYALNTLAAWQKDQADSGSFARMGIFIAQPSLKVKVAKFSFSDRWNLISESWSDFKTRFDDRAQQFLRAYEVSARKQAEDHGFVPVPKVPRDLAQKLECAALYLCGRKTPQEIASRRGYARDKSRIFRWIQDAVKLLGLEMRPAGRPSTRNVARKREF